jgi:hypothetical protein
MEISVLIEPVAGNGYRATGASPMGLSAEGTTRDEALRKLQDLVQARMSAGAEMVQLKIGPADPPWAKFFGTWDPDDPLIAEWEKAVEEYRRQMDEDPNVR